MFQRLTVEQLEYRARKLKDAYGFQSEQILDVRLLLARYLDKHTNLNFRIVEDWELLPNVEAQTYPLGNSIKIGKSLYDKFVAGDYRSELIVLEELAHYLFQHSGIRNRWKGDRDPTVSPRSIHSAEEWQAKYFAVALKAPIDQAAKCSSAQEIAMRFGLSAQAATLRYEEAQRYKRQLTGNARPIPSAAADKLTELRRRWHGTGPAIKTASPPKEFFDAARIVAATAQGYSDRPCPDCAHRKLLVAGGCWTCENCGTSDCN